MGQGKPLNALQFNFKCGEENKGGRFSECIQVTMAYLSTKLKGVRYDNEITGVDSDNESAELGITGSTYKAYELALI